MSLDRTPSCLFLYDNAALLRNTLYERIQAGENCWQVFLEGKKWINDYRNMFLYPAPGYDPRFAGGVFASYKLEGFFEGYSDRGEVWILYWNAR